MTTQNNNTKGIIFILCGMALFSLQDSLIKFVYEEAALYEIYFGRTFIAALILLVYLKIIGHKLVLKTHYPLLTITRVLLHFFVLLMMMKLDIHLIYQVWNLILTHIYWLYQLPIPAG